MRLAELLAGSGSSKPGAGPTCTVTARGATDEPVVLRVVLLACAEGVPEGDAETRLDDLALGEALGKGLFGESVRVAAALRGDRAADAEDGRGLGVRRDQVAGAAQHAGQGRRSGPAS